MSPLLNRVMSYLLRPDERAAGTADGEQPPAPHALDEHRDTAFRREHGARGRPIVRGFDGGATIADRVL